jgi:hypothetical protein
MTRTTTPIDAMFEMQRTAIQQSQRAFERSLKFNRRTADLFVEAIRTGESAREQGLAVTEAAVDAYFDAVEATVPADAGGLEELRATAHEQLEATGELQADTVDRLTRLVEENADASEEFVDEWAATVEEGFDAALSASEQFEQRTVAAAETIDIEPSE